jgi:MinD superfamily P-loop ATPase
MILAVASGKGGTGKTTVSSSLAWAWGGPLLSVDLDVEEPNLHLLLHPALEGARTAWLEVPEVDTRLCTACGACAEICQFKAISLLGEVLITFPEMCHGCGGCQAVCPSGAITPGRRELGEILFGSTGQGRFLGGRLRVGEAMSPPLMRQTRLEMACWLAMHGGDAIIDAPPGVSCPALSAVMDADAILLVTEPTPFGLHDLRLAQEAFGPLGKPMGVVVNRAGFAYDQVREHCRLTGLPVLAEIPFQRQAAEAYARGEVLAAASREFGDIFSQLARQARSLGSAAGRTEAVGHA